MLIGEVYCCKLMNIFGFLGEEIYLMIEFVNWFYFFEGWVSEFLILIYVMLEEIKFVLDGKYIICVIYFEILDFVLLVV